MKRFYFISFLMIFFLLISPLLINCLVFAETVPTVKLNMGHDASIGSVQDLAVKRIVEVAEKRSNGKLVLQNFPAAQLGSNLSMLENVIAGSQDIYWGDLTFLGNFVKDYQIVSMGFAFRDQKHLDKFLDSPTGREMQTELMRKGLLLLTKGGDMNPRILVTKKPIKTIEDIKGIKIRVPRVPISMKVWSAIGANPTPLPNTEMYIGLKQGVIDAVETPINFVWSWKFYEGGKYLTETNHVRGTRGLIINPKKYGNLPKVLQEVLLIAATEGEIYHNELLKEATVEYRKLLIDNGAIISDIDREPLQKRVLPIVNGLEKEGYWRKGLYDELQSIK